MFIDHDCKIRISVSPQSFTHKPTTEEVRSIHFISEIHTPSEMLNVLIQGRTMCYMFHTSGMFGQSSKRKSLYVGTQVIFIDVDYSEIPMRQCIDSLTHKPTFAYTSFSYPEKNRYRLAYCFSEPILGEKNFITAYNAIIRACGFSNEVDKLACNQQYYGTTQKADTYVSHIIYTPSDFGIDMNIVGQNDTDILMSDFSSMPIGKFLSLHHSAMSPIHRQAESTPMIDTKKGYYIYPEHYWEVSRVFEWRVDSTTGKKYSIIKKVPVGERKKTLFARGMIFKQNKPDITYPEMVYCLSYEVFHFFSNHDNKLDKKVITNTAKGVLGTSSFNISESRHGKFKIDKEYWINQGITMAEARRYITKSVNIDKFSKRYDFNMSMSDNLKKFKEDGYNISRASAYRYLDELKEKMSHYSIEIEEEYINCYNETSITTEIVYNKA